MSHLLDVRDLRVAIARGERRLYPVDGISFTLAARETLALLGESGCGKSMTALALLRLLPDVARLDGGRIELAGRELTGLAERDMRRVRGAEMAMIFQEPMSALNPVLSIGQQIGETLGLHRRLTGRAAVDAGIALLASVGMPRPAQQWRAYPFELSGGLRQRAMIAMALAGEPRLLLADEPTTALDVTLQAQILELLRTQQAARGMGMLLVTHDLGVVAENADRVAVMYAGELVEIAAREAFFAQAFHPYSRSLFACLPRRSAERLAAIPGQVPALDGMPAGCRFAPRCPQAFARCHQESPGWQTLQDGHAVRCHLAQSAPGYALPQPAAMPGSVAVERETVLEVRDLRVHFPIRSGVLRRTTGWIKAVDGIDLSVRAGQTLALVGESGCGKTTAGKAILGLLRASSGSVHLDGAPLRAGQRRRGMQMVFQDPYASLNPRMRIEEILIEGMAALAVGQARERPKRVAALLDQVGLPASAAVRYPHEFSGGQRQRIAIARALAVEPRVLICDEPTSALDVSVQAQILNLLRDLQAQTGLAYLFITHNLAVVDYLAHEVAVMQGGRIIERGRVAEVLHAPREDYTRTLIASMPRLDTPRSAKLSAD
jgi:peptide/nickel transport system ATP-binding protein